MQAQGRSKVGMLSIPGLTYPVRDLHLEDVLERTNFVIGRGSKYVSSCLKVFALSLEMGLSVSSCVGFQKVNAMSTGVLDLGATVHHWVRSDCIGTYRRVLVGLVAAVLLGHLHIQVMMQVN